jgi:hypothetical protein
LEAKQNNYNNQILKSNNKIKTTWEIVTVESSKKINKNNNVDIQEINVDGDSTDNRQVIASVFNEYFLSVAERTLLQDNNTNSNNNAGISDIKSKHSDNSNSNQAYSLANAFNNPFPNIQLKFSTTKEIENIIKSLKSKNTCGYDEISTKLLKISSAYITSLLNRICNTSFLSGTFPQRFKYSTVKPLFKKGDITDISNYRPIYILTSFSEILEKVMYNSLLEHVNNNNILVKELFGFRKTLTIEKATYELNNEIIGALNTKLLVGGIFCEIAKTFDCINRDTLLFKLNFCGINGKANNCIKSYLVDRYQRVEIENINFSHQAASKCGKIRLGVPQGSIPGPLLFLLYINDLSNFVKDESKQILFADDTSIVVINSNPIDFISDIMTVFEYLNKWFRANSLSLNFDKTHFVQFTTKSGPQINLDVSYVNKTISKAYDTKFLGLHIDIYTVLEITY